MAEYAVFNYIPKHIYETKNIRQLLNGISLIIKSIDVKNADKILAQIDLLSNQLKEYSPILEKKKYRTRQEIIAQMKINQCFQNSKKLLATELSKAFDTDGSRVKSIFVCKLPSGITVDNYAARRAACSSAIRCS
jgi:GTPase involved in cell partitioning and DNA repair